MLSEDDLLTIFTRYGPAARNYDRLGDSASQKSYESSIQDAIDSLEYSRIKELSKGQATVAGNDLVVLCRDDLGSESAPIDSKSAFGMWARRSYTVASKEIQSRMVTRLFQKDWARICRVFDLMKTVPKQATLEGWIWDTYCDGVIPSKTVLQLTRLGLASKKPVELANLPINVIDVPNLNLPSNIIVTPNVESAWSHIGRPGYYRIGIQTQATFDAFMITKGNRVLLFRYTTLDQPDGLSAVGLDQLADVLSICRRDDLLPYDTKGPRKGAEWWIVWVIAGKTKDALIPTLQFTTKIKTVKVGKRNWENYVHHYKLGLDHNVDLPPEHEEFKM
jgi:hypothetical protein